jgi:hypothetical protein
LDAKLLGRAAFCDLSDRLLANNDCNAGCGISHAVRMIMIEDSMSSCGANGCIMAQWLLGMEIPQPQTPDLTYVYIFVLGFHAKVSRRRYFSNLETEN